ncbi:MAG: type II secretion system protein [Myxococcota bacterium]
MRAQISIAGFTLLETMIAMAILAISLTALFGAEAGSVRTAVKARKLSSATLLARCKMGEIEADVEENGLPIEDLTGSDGCCDGAEIEGFECDWIVETIELPALTGEAEGEGAAGPETDTFETEGESAEDFLAGDAAVETGDVITELALGYAWPLLAPKFEEQVRRARVTVKWNEGSSERSFDVVQYVVSERSAEAAADAAGLPPPGGGAGGGGGGAGGGGAGGGGGGP